MELDFSLESMAPANQWRPRRARHAKVWYRGPEGPKQKAVILADRGLWLQLELTAGYPNNIKKPMWVRRELTWGR